MLYMLTCGLAVNAQWSNRKRTSLMETI